MGRIGWVFVALVGCGNDGAATDASIEDGSSADSQVELCGNGVIDADEVCDDNNRLSGDGCAASCLSNETCGNGVIDTDAGEHCDPVDDTLCPRNCRCDVLPDTGFSMFPDLWSVTNAVIDPNATGNSDPGEVVFPGTSACGPDRSRMTQSLCVRPFAEAGLLELAMAGRAPGGARVEVAYGGAPQDVFITTADYGPTTPLCLGEAAYGRSLVLAIERGEPPMCMTMVSPDLALDDVVVRAGDPARCPVPGTVLSGDLESTVGWTPLGTLGGTSEIIDDGTGNHVLRLAATGGVCQNPAYATRISPPLAITLPNPAIQFTHRGSAAIRVQTFDAAATQNVTFPAAGTTAITARMCVAADNQGKTFGLQFSLVNASICSNNQARETFIDDVTFVSDASCP